MTENDKLREPEAADAVALVRAHLAGDEKTVEEFLSTVDESKLFPAVVGLLIGVLADLLPGGEKELDERLAHWQANRLSRGDTGPP